MKPEIKERWIEALESGEYRKTKGFLVEEGPNTTGFCCLGVLTNLYVEETGLDYVWFRYRYQREEKLPPIIAGTLHPDVAEWAGLEERNPVIDMTNGGAGIIASNANDTLGWSFKKIAKAIKKSL